VTPLNSKSHCLKSFLVTIRLAPLLPTKVAMAQFPDVEHAVSAVQEILNTPHGPHIRKNNLTSVRALLISRIP